MKFEGEHLLPGQLGHFFIILAMVSSLVAAISYFLHARNPETTDRGWLRLGRSAFIIQFASLIAVFAIIYYICSQHYFEYMYAYKHASLELEPKYLLACIWEGQEGSFLLWSLWNGLLGVVFMRTNRESESSVLTLFSLFQWFLCLMILGIYFFDVRIGNSPFTLTRNEIMAPIFSRPDYLNFLKDGVGLNVLLRNYWMVIHPPVLFLGFSSTLVPYALAVSGLAKRNYDSWVKSAIPWSLFSMAVLGVGIMMGGKWAYESLSFGGYWAWDPVENASLVPWLIMVAGMHTLLIYRATGHSLKASYLFILLSFIFVLYSTFLTRTGILGDTSVHAFTEAGNAINIMIGSMVGFFAIMPFVYYFREKKRIPVMVKEEENSSREFWMFMGSLLLFLSAVFIIIITSIPVFNKTPLLKDIIVKAHGGPLALPEDPEFLYNKVMVMVAIMLGFMTATAQFLKYKYTEKGFFLKRIAIPVFISALVSAIILWVYPLDFTKHGPGFLVAIYAAFVAVLFSLIANAAFIRIGFKGNLKMAGSAISHAGFALMLAGILISSSNKKVISDSTVNGISMASGTDPMTRKQDDPRENLTLVRDLPTRMGPYEVTYTGDSLGHEKGRRFYSLIFRERNAKQGAGFLLKPDVYVMKDNNMSSNPDIKTFIDRDVFTYISYAMNEKSGDDTSTFRILEMAEGDTGFYSRGMVILNKIYRNPAFGKFKFREDDAALVADVLVISNDSMRYHAYPYLQIDSMGILQQDDTLFAQNMFVRFAGVTEDRRVKIGIRESSSIIDFIAVKAFIFPYVNLVWLGLIIMAGGILVSLVHRTRIGTIPALLIYLATLAGLFYMFFLGAP